MIPITTPPKIFPNRRKLIETISANLPTTFSGNIRMLGMPTSMPSSLGQRRSESMKPQTKNTPTVTSQTIWNHWLKAAPRIRPTTQPIRALSKPRKTERTIRPPLLLPSILNPPRNGEKYS